MSVPQISGLPIRTLFFLPFEVDAVQLFPTCAKECFQLIVEILLCHREVVQRLDGILEKAASEGGRTYLGQELYVGEGQLHTARTAFCVYATDAAVELFFVQVDCRQRRHEAFYQVAVPLVLHPCAHEIALFLSLMLREVLLQVLNHPLYDVPFVYRYNHHFLQVPRKGL